MGISVGGDRTSLLRLWSGDSTNDDLHCGFSPPALFVDELGKEEGGLKGEG